MWITYETGGLTTLHQEYPRYIYESKIDLTQKTPKIPNWISDDLRTKIMKRWEIDQKNAKVIQSSQVSSRHFQQTVSSSHGFYISTSLNQNSKKNTKILDWVSDYVRIQIIRWHIYKNKQFLIYMLFACIVLLCLLSVL